MIKKFMNAVSSFALGGLLDDVRVPGEPKPSDRPVRREPSAPKPAPRELQETVS
jgi:hypothetical protein